MTQGTHEQNYFAEWRQTVNRELEESARLHQQAAVMLAQIKGELDEHSRRLKSLETSPDGLRAMFGTYGGCLGQAIFTFIAGLSFILSVAALIYTVLH